MNGYFKWIVRLCCDGISHILKGNSDIQQSSLPDINLTTPPLMGSYGSTSGGGTRAGLFRTPISGGVQSATSAHGLPRPALAVRNLMEQVKVLSSKIFSIHCRFLCKTDFDMYLHPLYA